jgi:hypothetical protein
VLILRSIALLKQNEWLGNHALSFSSLQLISFSEANSMTTEFNELLPVPPAEKVQIWIIGTREQVKHTINEFYVRQIASDRAHFMPIVPAPFAQGKFMTVLER